MQEYSTSSIPPASEGNMNLLQRIINVFAAPGKCFAAVRANPRWIAPTVLVLLLSLIMTIYIMCSMRRWSPRWKIAAWTRSRSTAPLKK